MPKKTSKRKAGGVSTTTGALKAPPTAFMLWLNKEGRAGAKKARPELPMTAIASLCGITWNDMPSAEKLAWHVAAKKLRAAYDAQQTALLGGGRKKVHWTPTAGNACQIFSALHDEWAVGFIHARDGARVRVVYETEGEEREQQLAIDSETLRPWAPTINGACRVFSQTAGEWVDAVIVSASGPTITVHYDVDGDGYSKEVDAGDTDVLRWPLFSDGEPLVNVGRFRTLFKQGVLSISDARKFCNNFFIPRPGENPARTWKEVNAKLAMVSSKADPARIMQACANKGTIADMLKVAKKRKWYEGTISDLRRGDLDVALVHTLTTVRGEVATATNGCAGGGGDASPKKKGKDAKDSDDGGTCVIC